MFSVSADIDAILLEMTINKWVSYLEITHAKVIKAKYP